MTEEGRPSSPDEPDGATAADAPDDAEEGEPSADESSEDATERPPQRGKGKLRKRIWANLKEHAPSYSALISGAAVIVSACTLITTVHAGRSQNEIAKKQVEAALSQNAAAQTQSQLTQLSQANEQYSRALEMLGSSQPNLRISAIVQLLEVARFDPTYAYSEDGPYVDKVVNTLLSFIDTNSKNSACTAEGSIGTDVEYAVDVFSKGLGGDLFRSVIRDIAPGQANPLWPDQKDPAYISEQNRVFSRTATAARPNCWQRITILGSFERVSFEHISMPYATFHNADVRYAVFNGDNLDHLVVKWGTVENAHFDGSYLVEAKFIPDDKYSQSPNMQNATFVNARMCRAVITSDLRGVDFTSARLYGADLRGATNIGLAKWSDVRYDNTTLWPLGFEQQVPPTESQPNCG
ncbi:pentapeptide repeat-containing protein [Mycobacteroides abscessus]|uniref:pentapeptide repeat-containing protein n=1 Tax=Mycobacteroides abscessus TaxID=36809 RepID=UPI00092953C9|nr:pentapeptide repeat-containing protein [Mycobacteroides abscessus]SIE91733.1 Pentapeptide repeats (8 copies) [Mycobacteroides abscessus subsp. abscessus]